LAFGTPGGRFLTASVALPFGIAFAALVFAQEMLHLARVHLHLTPARTLTTVGVLGVFILLLLHVSAFRSGVVRGLTAAGRGLRAVFYDAPVAVLRLPLLRRLLASRPLRLFFRYLFWPLLLGGLTGLGVWLARLAPGPGALAGGGPFRAAAVLLSTRPGRDLQEIAADWAVRQGQRLYDLLPGLFRLVMEVSRWCLETIDRLLYSVDEWLRFRSGQG